MDNEFMNDYRKQNKRNNILLIIVVIVVFLVFLYFGGNFFIKKFDSRLIFINFFDDVFENLNDTVLDYSDEFKNTNIQSENNISLSFNIDEDIELNSIGFNTITQLDIDSSNLFVDYKYLENEKELLNFQISYDNQNFYFLFNELFDKVLKMNSLEEEDKIEFDNIMDLVQEQINRNFNISSSEFIKLLELTKEIVIDNIDEDKFLRSKEEVTIEEVKYKLDKHTYVLEGNDYNEFIIGILTDIKDNNEYMDILVNIFDLHKDNLINQLDEMIDEQNNNTDNIKEEYIIYTKGLFREVVGFGIVSTNDTEQSNIEIKYFNINDKYKLLIKDDSNSFEDSYYLFEGKKQDDIIRLIFKENEKLKFNITYKNVGNSMEIVIAEPNNEYAVRMYLSSLVEERVVTSNFSLEYSENDNVIKIGVSSRITPIEDILKLDYDNMIYINELTENDILKMQTNIEKIFEKSILFNSLFGYNSGSNIEVSM